MKHLHFGCNYTVLKKGQKQDAIFMRSFERGSGH